MRLLLTAAAFAVGLSAAPAVMADSFRQITSKQEFVSLISNRTLRYGPGVRLSVSPDGRISGNGLGRPVTGAWQWRDNFFCRDLFWGKRDLGPNCQMVQVSGSTMRFTSDLGRGDSADLRLD